MARVTGPLFSMSASGTIGKAVTYGTWKGKPWARVWFTPENPQTAGQVNVRTALSIVVAYWQGLPAPDKATWEAAAPQGMSGYNYMMRRAMDQYVIQLTTAVTPASTSYSGTVPAETWTWVAV